MCDSPVVSKTNEIYPYGAGCSIPSRYSQFCYRNTNLQNNSLVYSTSSQTVDKSSIYTFFIAKHGISITRILVYPTEQKQQTTYLSNNLCNNYYCVSNLGQSRVARKWFCLCHDMRIFKLFLCICMHYFSQNWCFLMKEYCHQRVIVD